MDPKVFQEQFGLLGDSPAMRQVIDKIRQIAGTDITVLLNGESGVGKDVTARAIHALSERKRKNLVIVNCGAIPEGIIESELFGHEKGAFTGAHEAREGYFERANGGTIFLDEIGDTPKNVQVKLLRILENGEFFRVGSAEVRKTNVRIIAATNKDLWTLVQKGTFREDLYYRLNTVQIVIPPLRERTEDIIPIFRKFVVEFSAKYDSVFQGFSDDAKALLTSYRWPGNVRELRNVAEQLVVLEKSNFINGDVLRKYLKGRQHEGIPDNLPVHSSLYGNHHTHETDDFAPKDRELIYRALIDLKSDVGEMKKMLAQFIYSNISGGKPMLPAPLEYRREPEVYRSYEAPVNPQTNLGIQTYPEYKSVQVNSDLDLDPFEERLQNDEIPSIEDAEKYLIEKALRKYEGNRRKASEALGVSERTLYRKLDQYGIAE
ncbi:sigma-54-dependent Fis family transcriptional regulator [bacterium]|nr:MAG: sigma-54-dependent Fis family transcriptional regulator [bacterium]